MRTTKTTFCEWWLFLQFLGGVHILQHMYDFDFLKMNYKAGYVVW